MSIIDCPKKLEAFLTMYADYQHTPDKNVFISQFKLIAVLLFAYKHGGLSLLQTILYKEVEESMRDEMMIKIINWKY